MSDAIDGSPRESKSPPPSQAEQELRLEHAKIPTVSKESRRDPYLSQKGQGRESTTRKWQRGQRDDLRPHLSKATNTNFGPTQPLESKGSTGTLVPTKTQSLPVNSMQNTRRNTSSRKQPRQKANQSRNPTSLSVPKVKDASRETIIPRTVNHSSNPDTESTNQAKPSSQSVGDWSAFRNMMAPFVKGEKERELSGWKWSEEKGRWWCEDKSTGLIIWEPESFI
ncbi:hypothetical protein B0T25DRAFT_259828 [Lasiosphaeria hispida]|uniref:Uncharacterized protein n=1 Tax=Lasiosphaeria hispida TaxID=260671 RepID=A0AAJ0HFY8_9PEZI|nr:hypothetical protein B0T25DRAFT_259828 [Lasiosphaeria hispida]